MERADVLFALASAQPDAPTMVGLCHEALAEATGDDARSARIRAFRSYAYMFEGDVEAALADARTALAEAERVNDPTLVAVAIARVGQAEAYAAEITPGLLERGVEIEERLGLPLEYYESPRVALTRFLMGVGELDQARAILEELEANAAARGDDGTRRQVLWRLSQLEWLAGRWERALSHATVAHELEGQAQDRHGAGMVGRAMALIEADLGLVEEARLSAETGVAGARAMSDEFFAISSLGVLGRLELALGKLESAGSLLRDLPGRLLSRGLNEPTAPVWADAIETLISVGDLEHARAYLDAYAGHAERIASSWAMAAAARCRGLLAAAEGDMPMALRRVRAALAELDGLLTHSSAAERCSAWARCAARRARRRLRGRRWSRRSRSSRSWARACGRRRPAVSSGGSAGASRPPRRADGDGAARRRAGRPRAARTRRSPPSCSSG